MKKPNSLRGGVKSILRWQDLGWDVLYADGYFYYLNIREVQQHNLTDELAVYRYLRNQGEAK